jgi:DNA-binding transcriptional MerR regulator
MSSITGTSITAACRALGVTPRALRHYEELGLLRCGRDRAGQRRFAPDQFDKAALIVGLRRLGLPIADIRPLLSEDLPTKTKGVRLQALLASRVAHLKDGLYAAETALTLFDAPEPPSVASLLNAGAIADAHRHIESKHT